ncbi:MAG: hypothetical protein EBY29_11815, partial [Planctomycetes bacterium]|nr:hypothetical protein [Planctomycetota bacterium]
GFDSNKRVIDQLNLGISHIEGVDSAVLKSRIQVGRFVATNKGEDLADVELVVIAVPTPLTIDRKPDLSYVDAACQHRQKLVRMDLLCFNSAACATHHRGTVCAGSCHAPCK